MSGGQQQRVAIARAKLPPGRQFLLADEPTGNLDSRSGREIMRILQELHAEGKTIILITHDPVVADHAQKIYTMCDGRLKGPAV
jgi:macrolide transport system ATP-binding/permease protein